ncbi:MAG: amidophosphoribosyltransferase, partial [Vampirovibrionales bacterium]|nr:amidophosphoribosyltransferase [Vampirovibrionales bacterium]
IVVAMGDCLIAARDCNGIRPLSLGQITEGPSAGTWVVASETCAMDIVGATNVRDIAPGEIWIGTRGGKTHSIRLSGPAQERFCVFEMVYFARTDSRLCEQSVYIYRLALGKLLAERDKTLLPPNAVDMVIAVPDSGTTAAIGYSQASGVPFVEGLIKNRYVGRTFINPSEGIRQQGLRLKLNPLTDVLSGKRVVVIDDSIVRGNTSRRLVALLKEAGVAEIHLRVSSPPVKHPCFYGIDMSDPEELIANHQNESQLKDWLGVDSLAYLPLEGLEQAFLATRAPGQSCKACFDNDYPAGVPSGAKTTLEPRDTIMLA